MPTVIELGLRKISHRVFTSGGCGLSPVTTSVLRARPGRSSWRSESALPQPCGARVPTSTETDERTSRSVHQGPIATPAGCTSISAERRASPRGRAFSQSPTAANRSSEARWQRLVSLVPGGGRLESLSRAGHYGFLERQDETLDLVREYMEGED